MAARRTAAKTVDIARFSQITTHAQASIEVYTMAADANGVKCISDFLGDLDGGAISLSVPEPTKEWLRGICYDFLRKQAERIETRADAVEAFLKAPPKAAVA